MSTVTAMPRIIPRHEIGLPARVTNINRITLRPLLQPLLGLILCHYTGNKRRYHGLSQAEVEAVIKSVHRWKANEYNYVIDWAGRVYEFAGPYQAAHASGYNATSYGVLFLNGVGEEMTHAQLCSFHFLFGMLMMSRQVQIKPWVLGHQEVAPTRCPEHVMKQIDRMRSYDPALHSQAL